MLQRAIPATLMLLAVSAWIGVVVHADGFGGFGSAQSGGDIATDVPPGTDADAVHVDVAGEIAAVTEKTVPVGADVLLIEDSAAGDAKKRIQVSNLPAGPTPGLSSVLAVSTEMGANAITKASGDAIIDAATGLAILEAGAANRQMTYSGQVLEFEQTSTMTVRSEVGTLNIKSGNASTPTGPGGGMNIQAGTGGATSGNGGRTAIYGGDSFDGDGGDCEVGGNDGFGTDRNGGDLDLYGGVATGSGTMGIINLHSGTGYETIASVRPDKFVITDGNELELGTGSTLTSPGGPGLGQGEQITIQPGPGDLAASGGVLQLQGGDGGATGSGGTLFINGGNGGATSGGGGQVEIVSGASTEGPGGDLVLGAIGGAGTNQNAGIVDIFAEAGTGSGTNGHIKFSTSAGEVARFAGSELVMQPTKEVRSADATTPTSNGSTLTLRGGPGGSTSGDGGEVNVKGGVPTEGAGGFVRVEGANGVGTDRNGGEAVLRGGNATGTGDGGFVSIIAGTSPSGTQGTIDFTVNNQFTAEWNSSGLSMQAGKSISSASGNLELVAASGGEIRMVGDPSTVILHMEDSPWYPGSPALISQGLDTNDGRSLTFHAAAGQLTGEGGTVSMVAGDNTAAGGSGGRVEMQGGQAGTGGTGGSLDFFGGSAADGTGGGVTIEAGAGTGAGANTGGDLTLRSGAGSGASGVGGNVLIEAGNGATDGTIQLEVDNTTIATVAAAGVSMGIGKTISLASASSGAALYDGGSGVITQTAVGSSGQVLTSNGSGAPTWETPAPDATLATTAGFTTTSSTPVLITGLTLTPAAGTYAVWATGCGFPQTTNATQIVSVYMDGAEVTNTEAEVTSGGAQTSGMSSGFAVSTVVTVNGAQAIEVRMEAVGGAFTAEVKDSQLLIMEVQ